MNYFNELKELSNNSYSPYSQFKVAAILVTNKGITKGINVENIAYGEAICAERSAIVSAISQFGPNIEFKEIHLLTQSEDVSDVTPCGSCRQVMAEFFTKSCIIKAYSLKNETKTYSIQDLLPYSFKDENVK